EVDGQASLLAIDEEEVGGFSLQFGASIEGACVVAAVRVLDLDDLGADVREGQRAPEPDQHAREVQHPNAGQRRRPNFAVSSCHSTMTRLRRAAPIADREWQNTGGCVLVYRPLGSDGSPRR